MNDKVKTPPNSKESEMMVLGCMLTNADAVKLCLTDLKQDDFYYTEHAIIFQAIKDLQKNDITVDILLTCENLKNKDKLKSVGGPAYITTLAQFVGISADIEAYIGIVKAHSQKRQLLSLAQELQKDALSEEEPQNIIISTLEELKTIERDRGTKDKFPIKFINEFESNFLLTSPPKKPMLLEYSDNSGKASGFLPKGIVSMLVGAGGLGKTHLLAQLAISVATGTAFLDTFTTTDYCGTQKKGNVFLGLGENQYDDIHRLLWKASKKLREHQPDIEKEDPLKEAGNRIAPFSFCGQQAAFIQDKKPSIYFRHLKMRLMEIAPKDGWSLIILDPVSRLLGADAETDNAAATQFIALLEELSIDLPGNPTILFAHHVNKTAIAAGNDQKQSAARGSSALTDGVRWQCNYAKLNEDSKKELTTDSIDLALLKMTKSNFTGIIDDMYTRKDFEGYIERYIKTQKNPINQPTHQY